MQSLSAKRFLVPLTAVAALGLGVPQAGAQGFFDMLFGGPVRKQQPMKGEFPPPPPKRKVASGGGARIASPTYSTYKADRLVKVDFSTLTEPATTGATTQNIAFDVSKPADASFSRSLSGLDDYELMAESDIGKALVAYYGANPGFIWVTGSDPNERAQQALRVLGDAASYGLTPSDYQVDVPASAPGSVDAEARARELIRFEMALSARVLRLMLDGVSPQAILCITFTKAGAAEMAHRIHERLATWVRMSDGDLRLDLHALGLDWERPGLMTRARSLFATVIDSPGGAIRVQTIHSFCQTLLASFPLEAKLLPGFRAIEEDEAAALKRQILGDLLKHDPTTSSGV